MNTQDTSASDDATNSPGSSQDDSQEDTGTENQTTEDSSQEEDTRSLKPDVQNILDNFDTLSEEKQAEKLANLEGQTARPSQRDAAKLIREMYDITPSEKKETQDTAVSDEKLEEMRKLEQSISEKADMVGNHYSSQEKSKHIDLFLTKNKVDASPDTVLRDKKFVAAYLENRDIKDVAKRTMLSMTEVYGADSDWIQKQHRAASGGMASGGAAPEKKKLSLKDYQTMTTAEWEALQ